ncbi:MAG TPA: DUF4148 domain-containing protein [Ramlibacter sp.]|uniref:DUF4148 domain-containing protein n=1 Tax=Ramlibacter sp. TaxID=1917967 RepID=UPI002BF0F77A|nr:DUF4148 domain-containing protein [Ramlibacter sp.]HVZ44140.1 DUF4148 domain-containing protein [Ramlibacter sp.]
MNAKSILAIATLAVAATGVARADEYYGGQNVASFEGSRTRAEVMAEAAAVPAARSTEPAGSRVAAPIQSTVDARVLRAQAAQAVRLGRISAGELSF